ncbi:DgyrCDS4912 [Dimorphilus gyrociliatus]|uniref:DgyrCDS4912 n=1 Tax=Dimorphilus gyrociliatus TaxID=2664684 RepID=A0A7I8VJU1_9ANNE|nr:DgyrCDS4912 [Dimorphilus gyrociliatus]
MGLSTSKKKKLHHTNTNDDLPEVTESKEDNNSKLSTSQTFFKWDINSCSKNLVISDDFSTISKPFKTGTIDSVRSKFGYNSGRHVYRVNWPIDRRGEDIAVIGFSTKHLPLQSVCGSSEKSFGLNLIDNSIIFNNAKTNTNADEEVPDTFIVILDLIDDWWIIKMDNKYIKISLKELKNVIEKENNKLYLTTSMTKDGGRVNVNIDWRNPSILLEDDSPHILDSISMKYVFDVSIQESWLTSKSILKQLILNDGDKIKSIIIQSINLFKLYPNMLESSIAIYSADDSIKIILRYYELLSRNLEDEKVHACFKWMTVFLFFLTNTNSTNSFLAEENGILKIIGKVLKMFQNKKNPKPFLLIKLLLNLSKPIQMREKIRQSRVYDIISWFSDNDDVESYKMYATMIKARVMNSTERSHWNIDETILQSLTISIKLRDENGNIDFKEMTLNLYEVLDCISLICENSDNGKYFLRNGVTYELIDIISIQSTHTLTAEKAVHCLNQLFNQIKKRLENGNLSDIDDIAFLFKSDRLNMILHNLLGKSSDVDLHKQIKTCLIEIQDIAKICSNHNCFYKNLCRKFIINNLKINDAFLEPAYDMCYCKFCFTLRGDKEYYARGYPESTYALPIGWYRIGLKLPPRAKVENAFEKWHRAFHGTRVENILKILQHGDLLMPGDITAEGQQLKELDGHFNLDYKPEGFDTRQVFVSPTIRYAGLNVYSYKQKWKDFNVKVAFQVLIKPGTYKIGKETIGTSERIDQRISNDEIEWSTKRRGVIIPYGLLIKVTKENLS